jgi:hypothetical protein
MKKIILISIVLLLSAAIIAGCGSSGKDGEADTDPYALYTAIALTAGTKSQQIAATLPAGEGTPVSGTPVSDVMATVTPMSTEVTPPVPTPTVSESPSPSGDLAEFVEDITIPDETELPPNATFVKIWRLKNVGSTTWTTDYKLVFVGGDKMEVQDSIPLPKNVAPGETVEISVSLIAPANPAHYTGYFNLMNPNGDNFGVGVGAIEAFWVDIVVSEDAPPFATPTPAVSPEVVKTLLLYVDNTTAVECPHTFYFTALIALTEPAPVTFQLETDETTPEIQMVLPDPVTVELNEGTNTFEYEFNFMVPVQGYIVMHILSPGDQYSNYVNLSLTCP